MRTTRSLGMGLRGDDVVGADGRVTIALADDALVRGQQAFGDALFDATRAEAAVGLIAGQAVQQRLGIYRGNLTSGWDKTLSAAYPVVRQLVGEEFFTALAREYGKAWPSQDPDLNKFGEHLAQFLEGFEHVADYPWLPDIARLEWKLHRACYAPDAPALGAAQLSAYSPEQVESARFTLAPSAVLDKSAWATARLWLAHQQDGPPFPAQMREDSYALVVRPRWQPQLVLLPPGAFAALSVLAAGHSFGEALDAAFDIDEGFDVAAHLKQWLELGVFAAAEEGAGRAAVPTHASVRGL
jgi:hypothetical protein